MPERQFAVIYAQRSNPLSPANSQARLSQISRSARHRSERAPAPQRPRDLATRGDEKLSTAQVGDRIAVSL
jgi:hypothetical protein